MSIYGVTAVQTKAKGAIERVRLCEMDTKENRWVGQAREVPAHMILDGNQLVSIFGIQGTGWTGHGAKFKYVVDTQGRESIELESQADGQSLADLVQAWK